MEEPNTTLEVPSSRDLSTESKGCEEEYSFGSHRDNSVSMPICFLIKEQSKSIISIQELQRRLARVESVQEDVIDAIVEFRNFLSDSKSYNSLNPAAATSSLSVTRSPANIFSKLTSSSHLNTDVPSSVVEVPHSVLKTRSYSSKNSDPVYSEFGKSPIITNLSPKHFDLAKSKDSALESDKQDSGLDSDCREHHEIHPSLNKNDSNLVNAENNDELLQLLDEVSHRSTILQKQLAVAEEATTLIDLKDMSVAHKSQSASSDHSVNSKCADPKFLYMEASSNEVMQSRGQKSKSFTTTAQSHTLYTEEKMPTVLKQNSRLVGLFEANLICDKGSRKRGINGIDSNMVSSILKETNIVDLQRQALIYLVDNAVLHTKLQEVEQMLSSKSMENDKVESTLKEEARLLMMENRELRISLEEQKMETNTLKSRLAMLERVVQSISNENQELNWQLGESLNLQNMPRRGSHNYSSSLQADASKSLIKRSSLPIKNEMNIHCVKTKLLSNNSSFLDVTVEDPGELVAPASNAAFKCRNGPIQSSTPMVPFQRFRGSLNSSSIPGEVSPANFHSVKKCLKPGGGENTQRSAMCLENAYDIPKTKNFSEETLNRDNVNKFPFNTILEKLKSNSEYRLSKSASTKASEIVEGSPTRSSVSKSKVNLLENENISHHNETRGNSSDIVLQRRKGRNIQQRIQNILDRIVNESEDVS